MEFTLDTKENKITVFDVKKDNTYLKYSMNIYGDDNLLYRVDENIYDKWFIPNKKFADYKTIKAILIINDEIEKTHNFKIDPFGEEIFCKKETIEKKWNILPIVKVIEYEAVEA